MMFVWNYYGEKSVYMKAIILAAGMGQRLEPLTETRPKCLIQVMGKSFLWYVIDTLKKSGFKDKDIGVVVGYKKEMVVQFAQIYGFKLNFIEQKEQLGTGHAIQLCQKFTKNDDFIVVMGDNLYSAKDLKKICKKDKFSYVAGYKHKHPERYGVLVMDKNKLEKIVEKPREFVGDFINTGLYKFTPEIYNVLKKVVKTERGEIEITDAISMLCKVNKMKSVGITDYWLDFGYPWEIFRVNDFLLDKAKEYRKGTISDKAELVGKVIVEEGTEIRFGSHIVGPVYIGKNCEIGPNCFIESYTSISNNVHIGAACEVHNSLIMNDTNIPHHNYVGDSIIGAHCTLGSGTKVETERNDQVTITMNIRGKMVDSYRKKIGVMTGDHVKTGVNVSIMPGVKIGSNAMIGPNVVVDKDVPAGKAVFLRQSVELR